MPDCAYGNGFADFFHFLHGCVHFAHDVSVAEPTVAFVVNGTSLVERKRDLFHFAEGSAVAGLVAERPEQHASVVAERANHIVHSVAYLFYPTLFAAGNRHRKPVSFEVVFAHNHNSVAVAEFVKRAGVGIVRSTQAVDVVVAENDKVFSVSSAGTA